MTTRPEICLYCDGEGNGDAGPCGFCDNGIPLDTQEDWDESWAKVVDRAWDSTYTKLLGRILGGNNGS